MSDEGDCRTAPATPGLLIPFGQKRAYYAVLAHFTPCFVLAVTSVTLSTNLNILREKNKN